MNRGILIGGLILAVFASACGQRSDPIPSQSLEAPDQRAPENGQVQGASSESAGEPARAPTAPAAGATTDQPFLMAIEDVFSISERGTVVTGRVETGMVRRGDEIEIVGIRETRRARVNGVEMFRKISGSARAGDNVGILLGQVTRDQVERGQVLARPGSIPACSRFDASLSGLPGPDGRNRPFTGSRRPQFYFRTTDVTGSISGSGNRVLVTLIAPIAMNQGHRFSIRQDGRTIGSGTVLHCR